MTQKNYDPRPPEEEIWFFKVLWPQKRGKSNFPFAGHMVAGEKSHRNKKGVFLKDIEDAEKKLRKILKNREFWPKNGDVGPIFEKS